MELQPTRRRAAQSLGVVTIAAGVLAFTAALGLLLVEFRSLRPRGVTDLVPELLLATLGTILVVVGRKLLAWGSGDRD